jgi:FkbM family methyltransferase
VILREDSAVLSYIQARFRLSGTRFTMQTFNLPEFEKQIYEKMRNFIVIGSFDGFNHDNFFPLVSARGNKNARIVFVEPTQRYHQLLPGHAASLPQCFSVSTHNLAISDKAGTLATVTVKPGLTEKYGWFIKGCACVVEDGKRLDAYMKDVEADDLEHSQVRCITFHELLSLEGPATADFLQIDTEGCDERICATSISPPPKCS